MLCASLLSNKFLRDIDKQLFVPIGLTFLLLGCTTPNCKRDWTRCFKCPPNTTHKPMLRLTDSSTAMPQSWCWIEQLCIESFPLSVLVLDRTSLHLIFSALVFWTLPCRIQFSVIACILDLFGNNHIINGLCNRPHMNMCFEPSGSTSNNVHGFHDTTCTTPRVK